MSDLFELKELSFFYPGQGKLIEDTNLFISAKDSILLMGENGSGKSTLLKLITGLLKPTHGKVLFHGKPLAQATAQTFSSLVFLLQNAHENLFGLSPRHDLRIWHIAHPERITDKALKQIVSQYRDKWDQPYTELSDGEIRALLMSVLPFMMDKFWILDEPFDAMDSRRKCELIELMKQKGRGMLVVSHSAADFGSLFDRALHLENGLLREH
ncbi:MAG: energy-coupling factor ABC transporter ATP-binding protein [Candidatus Cloacimonadaceae bacterium]|nr:energy-coupling factor ABC transporter ATP-binding protein [Candidatus Cloacimonadaceae bacterium]MDP3114843.1 energy-coupling factor ABC transporter ATP-binding protein [Candidatus Cloacimonadaceae bacterium]